MDCCNCLGSCDKSGGKSDESKKSSEYKPTKEELEKIKTILQKCFSIKINVYKYSNNKSNITNCTYLADGLNSVKISDTLGALEGMAEHFNTFKGVILQNYIFLNNDDEDKDIFVNFNNIENFKLSVILKSNESKIDLVKDTQLITGDINTFSDYYSKLQDENKLVLVKVNTDKEPSDTEYLTIFYGLVDMNTLKIKGYTSYKPAKDENLIDTFNFNNTFLQQNYLIGYFKDLKDLTFDNFVTLKMFKTEISF